MKTWIRHGFRWSARITGLLLVGLVAVVVAGQGPPNPLHAPPSVQVEFLGLLLVLAGCLAGWRWEGLGGLLVVAGFGAFVVTELAVNGKLPGGAIPLFAVPGVLFLAAFGVGRRARSA